MRKWTLSEFAEILEKEGLLVRAEGEAEIVRISYDSRTVTEGTLFVCKGLNFKEEYLAGAAEKGAAAYVAEKEYGADLPRLIVSDVRKALSILSIAYFGRPFEAFTLVGLTGTKGKTTTTYMLKGIFDAAAGRPTGILSTVETYTGGETKEAHLTTPESLELMEMFDSARKHGLPYLTMEVSSQAYKVDRVYGVPYDVGLFLNIDEDHIGPLEHPDYEDYLECKLGLMRMCRLAVIFDGTRDFARVRAAAEENGARIVTYGSENADYRLGEIRKDGEGFVFTVLGKDGWSGEFAIDLEGRFNLTNALAAVAAAKELGIGDEAVRKGISHIYVPGRMNIYHKDGALIMVDYAHNFMSFTELFESLRQDYPGRIIRVLSGAPGGKNYKRRKDIGELCGKYADVLYLAAEDPGFEDPAEICAQMEEYALATPSETGRRDRARVVIETDRSAAVRRALAETKAGEIVIIAGKGEEIYQKVRGQYLPYESDTAIVEEFVRE